MGGYYASTVAPYNTPPYTTWEGVFTYKSAVRLTNVSSGDGTSNTMMFGEYAGGWITWGGSGGLPDGIVGGHWTAGFNYTGFGGPMTNRTGDPTASQWAFFSSQHTNVVNVSFCDGSVPLDQHQH